MKFIDKFVRTLEGALHKEGMTRSTQDVGFVRQSSPPDERDAEIAEACSANEAAPSREPVEQQKSVGRG